jgi:hypothetical protein
VLCLEVEIGDAATGFAFEAAVTINGAAHAVGTVRHRVGESCTWILTAPCPSPVPTTVDLTLKPDPQGAADAVGLPSIWGQSIVLDGLPELKDVILYTRAAR